MTSLRKLASDLGMTVSQVRTSIKKLQQTGEIDTIKSKRFTKIILLNYENYQADIIGTNHLVKHVNNNKVFYEMSLKDIDDDLYGFCETCGIEIGIKRLEARPTATQCIDCKTVDEIKEKQQFG